MVVTQSCSINPPVITNGDMIRVFDTSTSTGEDIYLTEIYINEGKTVTASSSPNIYITNANTLFAIGDTVLWSSGQPGGFSTHTTYYVKTTTSAYITLSSTKNLASTVSYTTPGTNPRLFKGCIGQFPELRPYPVSTPVSRDVVVSSWGSGGGYSSASFPFYTQMTTSSKPTKDTIFKNATVFLYNSTTATIIGSGPTTGHPFICSDLKFTNSINKAGTATFTVIGKGATTAEKLLLEANTNVAIITGWGVSWSGKILRAEQNVMTLYTSTSTAMMWDVECESDIGKMKLQDVLPASIGRRTGSIGSIITALVNSTTGINWNGTANDPGLRSNEGPGITYEITKADMFSQFATLSKIIDFDWRTRLVFYRYNYTGYNGSTLVTIANTSPYNSNLFAGMWAIFLPSTGGILSYGKITSNGSTSLVFGSIKNPTLPATTGTIIILGNPVLDCVSDLSQPQKIATFRMNSPIALTPSYGYEFDDKTDKKLLATKVVAKGKTSGGNTITSSVAAVTPYNPTTSFFEYSTPVTHRSEGTVISVEMEGSAGWHCLEGWGYVSSYLDYIAYKFPDGTWYSPQYTTRIAQNIIESYVGTQRVTKFYNPTGHPEAVGGTAFIVKSSELASLYGSIYVKNPSDISYTNGMDIIVGGETITTVDTQLDPVYGYRIRYIADGTANHRDKSSPLTGAHIPGSLVFRNSVYSESSPVAGSPVAYHGIILQTYTVDQNVSIPILEMYATLHLIANSYYYRKASFWCPVHEFYKTDPRLVNQLVTASFISVGDRISCLPKDTDLETHTIYGQLKNIWQVISYTFDYNRMSISVELGDFERNTFTLMADKTAAINQTIT